MEVVTAGGCGKGGSIGGGGGCNVPVLLLPPMGSGSIQAAPYACGGGALAAGAGMPNSPKSNSAGGRPRRAGAGVSAAVAAAGRKVGAWQPTLRRVCEAGREHGYWQDNNNHTVLCCRSICSMSCSASRQAACCCPLLPINPPRPHSWAVALQVSMSGGAAAGRGVMEAQDSLDTQNEMEALQALFDLRSG